KTTILDLDKLMDSTLDNVADIPDYMNPPNGLYVLSIHDAVIEKGKAKEDGKPVGSRFKLTYKVDETIETTEAPVADGTLFNETFMGTEQGLEFFKKRVKSVMNADDLSGVAIRDLLEGLKGVQFKAALTTRTSISNGKSYENVNIRPIHD